METRDVVTYFALNTIVLLAGSILLIVNVGAIGGSLVAAGITAYVVFWATYINSKRSVRERRLLTKLYQLGVCDINERRLLYPEYAAARINTTAHLDIMGFGLRNFIEDNADSFNEWAKSFEIRILVVHPDSSYCGQRDYEEKDSPGKIGSDVLHATHTVQQLGNPRVQLRWYRALPVTNLLRMDNTMWVGPYLVGQRSRNAHVLTLEGNGLLFQKYLAHFESVWSDPQLSCEPDPRGI